MNGTSGLNLSAAAVNETANNATGDGENKYDSYDESQILFEFITNGVLLNLVGVLGIMGNIISMIILSRPQMRSSINYLLTGLARCDTVLILTSMFLFGLPAVYKYTKTPFLFSYYYRVYPFLSPVVYPLALIAQTVSVYLTLTVTLERFVAVCHPLRARSLCTYGRARLYVLLIIIFSTLYNLPRFWEVTLEAEVHEEYNITVYTPLPTELRSNQLYISVYIHWLYLLFIYFVPFSSMAILNAAIYRQVRRANQERARLSRLQKKEIGLATMLLIVVLVFLLCNFLALVTNILEAFYGIILDHIVKTSNLLVTINSSVNFVIYVIYGEKFKRLFLKLFCTHNGGRGTMCGGRESPECATMHEDSVMLSNGDLSSRHSIRATAAHRANGSVKKVARALPCVYYPSTRDTQSSDKWTNNHNQASINPTDATEATTKTSDSNNSLDRL